MNETMKIYWCGAWSLLFLVWGTGDVLHAQATSPQENNQTIVNPAQVPARLPRLAADRSRPAMDQEAPGTPDTTPAHQNALGTPESAAPGTRRVTLLEAVAMALQNNRDVLLAQTAVSQAEAEFRESRSVFRPEVFLGSGIAATKGYPLSIEGAAPSIFTVSSTQALFNPNLKNLEKQASQMRLAAEKSLENKQDEIVAQTVLTYLDLDRSRRSLEYVQSRTGISAETEQIIQDRVQAGLEPPLEDTKARLNTARFRNQAVALQNRIGMLEFTLRDLIGRPQTERIITEPAEVPALSPEETVEQLEARAVESNPGIKTLAEEIRAKEFQMKSEDALRWPRVNLVGQYGLFSDINNFSSYFKKFTRNNATVGLSILVPLYDRDRISARLSKAQAELASARYRWSNARAAVARQVRELWGTAQEQAAALEVARLELELSRRSLDVVLSRFQDGRVNRLAVEQARSEEDDKWVNFFDVGYQAEKARLELLRLSGAIRSVFR